MFEQKKWTRRFLEWGTIFCVALICFSKKAGAQESMFHWKDQTRIDQPLTVDQISVSHLITVYEKEKFSLAQCSNLDQLHGAKITWSVLEDIGKTDGTMPIAKEGITIEEGIVHTNKTGLSLIKAHYKKGTIEQTSYLAVNVMEKGDTSREKHHALIYEANEKLHTNSVSKENLAKRYHLFHEAWTKIQKLESYEKDCKITQDGKHNYWYIPNGERYEKEDARLNTYFKNHCGKLQKIEYLSEYDGIVLKWSKKWNHVDMVSVMYAQHKAYSHDRKKVSLLADITNEKGKKTETRRFTIEIGENTQHLELSRKKYKKGTYKVRITNWVGEKESKKFTYKNIFQKKNTSIYAKNTVKVYKNLVSGKVLGYYTKGKRYHCLERGENGWLRVRINGKTGYVKKANVSYEVGDIVSRKDTRYSYGDMKRNLYSLANRYGDLLHLSVLAYTADQNTVYSVRMGKESAKTKIVIQSTMHAREWLNTQLIMLMIEDSCKKYYGRSYEGENYTELFSKVCFYIVPMTNPDGVNISQYGLKGVKNKTLRKKVKKLAKGNYKRWKANARGVDLNRNFPTGFAHKGPKKAKSQNYGGKKPLSEPESRGLANLIEQVKPKAVINYHEVGRVIYYSKSSKVTRIMRKYTGYTLSREKDKANGNLSDWLNAKKISWCTPETCLGAAPVSHGQLEGEWKKHKNILPALAKVYL